MLENSTVEDVDQSKLFAVVKFCGKQYKIAKVNNTSYNTWIIFYFYIDIKLFCQNDVIVADNINDIDIGDSVTVNDVRSFIFVVFNLLLQNMYIRFY